MPIISVIVPIYNVEKYIHRCIGSILAQTFTDFELILVDDGSPDNCPAICDEYAQKDSRIQVIHKENGGVSAARNDGLDIAQGEYVAFCDSDDWMNCDYLDVLYSAILSSGADVAVSQFQTIDVAGNLCNTTKHSIGVSDYHNPDLKYRFLLQTAGVEFGWEVWTRLFDNRIIQDNNIRFCTKCGNYAEDLAFVLEYSLFSKSQVSLESYGYNYFLRDASMMRQSKGKIKLNELNEVSLHVWNRYKDVFHHTKQKSSYCVLHFLIMRIELQKLVGTPRYQDLHKEIAKINNAAWFYSGFKGMRQNYNILKAEYGTKVAQQIILLSHYCKHSNWRRFQYESAIAYKFFIKG